MGVPVEFLESMTFADLVRARAQRQDIIAIRGETRYLANVVMVDFRRFVFRERVVYVECLVMLRISDVFNHIGVYTLPRGDYREMIPFTSQH